ncbi:hypothetical protein [Mycobacterium sp. 852002-30065_SCH5024008]|nr:hypothetical protein [Mycobacterium sp. 852002-30065_SCH5024008]
MARRQLDGLCRSHGVRIAARRTTQRLQFERDKVVDASELERI